MTKTVLITGASSGIGQATALWFQRQGWQVAATMRSPEKATVLKTTNQVLCLRLDVTEPESIQAAIDQTLAQFQKIDAIVNNAGYALVGPFEAYTPEQIQRQYDTNVFGLMAVTRAILPHFRQQGYGTIVNVASMGGRLTVPLYSLYHSTKWAVEGFSESLQYELEPFNIKVKLIEPGPIKTDFYDRSADVATKPGLTAYDSFVRQVLPRLTAAGENGSSPEFVARIIYQATTDNSWRLRYPAGGNAGAFLFLRKLFPDSLFRGLVRQMVVK